jgi:hypothetical protein
MIGCRISNHICLYYKVVVTLPPTTGWHSSLALTHTHGNCICISQHYLQHIVYFKLRSSGLWHYVMLSDTNVSEDHAASIFRVKLEVVSYHNTTWIHNPEDFDLKCYHREGLNTCTLYVVLAGFLLLLEIVYLSVLHMHLSNRKAVLWKMSPMKLLHVKHRSKCKSCLNCQRQKMVCPKYVNWLSAEENSELVKSISTKWLERKSKSESVVRIYRDLW